MQIDILTIFPDFFSSPLEHGIIRRARQAGIVSIEAVDLRAFTEDRHRTTDDRPYGGGEGMVMIPAPIARGIEYLKARAATSGDYGHAKASHVVYLSPKGRVFDQLIAERLSRLSHLILLCGRYEGVDQRVVDLFVDEEISVGDFVLSGGEPAALVVVDAIVRLLPGALGCESSAEHDSFSSGLLEHPHYTRPREFKGQMVPEVLLSGDHAAIAKWRRRKSLELTLERRPDLLETAGLDEDDVRFLRSLGWKGRS